MRGVGIVMRIRFLEPTFLRLEAKRGDELVVAVMTPEVEALLLSARLDGRRVAEVIDEDEEFAVTPSANSETAVVGRGRRHARRPEAVP